MSIFYKQKNLEIGTGKIYQKYKRSFNNMIDMCTWVLSLNRGMFPS